MNLFFSNPFINNSVIYPMSEDHFAKALRNLTMDAAAGDAIRYLTDKGYTPTQIKETLTFPAPMDYIVQVMWDRLVATRKILLEDPVVSTKDPAGEYETVEQYDSYGRKSFLRVRKQNSEEISFSSEDYVKCEFASRLAKGEVFDNELISKLPWPSGPVWGIADIFHED